MDKAQIKKMVDMRMNGETIAAVAKELGISQTAVKNHLKEYNNSREKVYPPANTDLNGDGVVDEKDLSLFMTAYNQRGKIKANRKDLDQYTVVQADNHQALILRCNLAIELGYKPLGSAFYARNAFFQTFIKG